MRILVIGSGGREHALVWKLAQSPKVDTIFVAPGNGGTALEGVQNVAIDAGNVVELVTFARDNQIDLVVPGPELALTEGITDAMNIAGIPCFGPDRYCAQLEGSKFFAKKIMVQANVPTAASAVFENVESAHAFIEQKGAPLVIKADGLAAGKGVIIAKTNEEAHAAIDQIMGEHCFGSAGDLVVIEEFLEGEEVSLLCLCDGENAVPLPSAQDHKAAYDQDTGPNTGGMGAYSPAPILPDNELEQMTDIVVRPILAELAKSNHPFKGILYAGLMITKSGPKVLEYNVRFGDPECQPLLMRLDSDLVDLMFACIKGTLKDVKVTFSPLSALGVVVASAGYPGSYKKGMPISGIEQAEQAPKTKVFHSGTQYKDGQVIANGGRVLCVTALGEGLALAKEAAYKAVACITMPDSRYRTDIGSKGIRRLEQN